MGKKYNIKTVAIQGDNLRTLKVSDTSLYIASQLQQHKIFWYEPQNLSFRNGVFTAKGTYIRATFDGDKLQYEKLEDTIIDLSTVSCIMIRQDPPVDMHYIASTHILSLLSKAYPEIFFVNHPDAVRNYVEKLLPIMFSQTHTPPTLISNNLRDIESFLIEHKKIIMKPIYGYGGYDIITVSAGEENLISEYLDQNSSMQAIVQKFLPEIYNGDIRVIICAGDILGVLGRLPNEGDFLTNTGMGGRIVKATLSENQTKISKSIAKNLKTLGIFFAGIDMIGESVIEINITSPGLLTLLHKEYGSSSTEKFFKKLEKNILSN